MDADNPRIVKLAVYNLYLSIIMLKKVMTLRGFLALATAIWDNPEKFSVRLNKWQP